MNKKSFLALIMAMTMILGTSMTAFAATGDATGGGEGNTLTGNGDVEYVDTVIYEIGLPTSTSIDLMVDPQGLANLENGETASADDLADGAGKVTCATIPAIVNNGSVDAKVSVALSLTGDATGVTTVEAVNADTANNVLLYAIPSAVDTPNEDGFVASSKGIVLSSSAATIDFILPKAAYVFSKDESGVVTYERDGSVASHGTAIQFAGLVNKNADWSDYVKESEPSEIGMTAVFTFTHTLGEGDVADSAADAPYAMKAYTGTTVQLTVPDVEPSMETAVTYSGSGDLEIPYVLGTGDAKVADAITDIAVEMDNNYYTVNGVWDYTNEHAAYFAIEEDKIVITEEWIAYYADYEQTSFKIYVIYDDNDALDENATYAEIVVTLPTE